MYVVSAEVFFSTNALETRPGVPAALTHVDPASQGNQHMYEEVLAWDSLDRSPIHLRSKIGDLSVTCGVVEIRIGRLRLNCCSSVPALAVFLAYASNSEYDNEELEAFYMELEKFYKEDHTHYKVIVGDFNAEIGPRGHRKNFTSEPAVWRGPKLRLRPFPRQYITVLRELYSGFTTTISPFYNDVVIDVKRGVRQRDTISQKLFSAIFKNVMRELECEDMRVQIDGQQLHFASLTTVLITPSICHLERTSIMSVETLDCS
ncbi:unnamed protein product [Heligmosomoides polygyrus]|uniref:Endo/exonuclease/phosphatase domain-containing protein n=1 Tax=Heligmosomoides polygyrus TaxID=6339 RepID=A0A3P8B302_HELPZ|nr:unnamed protein product [Heligmosomoides polygyrus]